jgi:CRP-like cAMP-binding protein
VSVVLEGDGPTQTQLAELGPGDHFGEIELLRGGPSVAGVRASGTAPVELVALPSAELAQLIGGAPQAEQNLGRMADQRLESYRRARQAA